MFEAPEIYKKIPDIAQIYAINDIQIEELEEAKEILENNMDMDTMDEATTARWEDILKITPSPLDTLDDRRLRVKVKRFNRAPYSYRVIQRAIKELAENGQMSLDSTRTEMLVTTHLETKRQLDLILEMLNEYISLNIAITVHNELENTIKNPRSIIAVTYAHTSNRITESYEESNIAREEKHIAMALSSDIKAGKIIEDNNSEAYANVQINTCPKTYAYQSAKIIEDNSQRASPITATRCTGATTTNNQKSPVIVEDYNQLNTTKQVTHAASATSATYNNAIS